MKTILVPTDFSENAKKSLEFAQKIAQRYQATITLIHAYHPPIIDASMQSETILAMVEQSEQSSAETLATWQADCEEKGFECETKLVHGAASDAVLDEIAAHKPMMVVMGRTGRGGWFDKIVGSVATAVGVKASCPVLVVPPQSQTENIKHILYATELERPEKNALGLAFDIAEHFGAQLSLIKVNAPYEVNIFDDSEFVSDINTIFGGKKYDLKIVEADTVLDGLKHYAEENQVDLLIMATRKRDWLSELINPSFSKKMIATTNIPLLVCHLQEEA